MSKHPYRADCFSGSVLSDLGQILGHVELHVSECGCKGPPDECRAFWLARVCKRAERAVPTPEEEAAYRLGGSDG